MTIAVKHPLVLLTADVKRTFSALAEMAKIKPAMIDFEILSCKTTYKNNITNSEIAKEDFEYSEPAHEVTQDYTIKVLGANTHDPLSNILVLQSKSKNHCYVEAVFKPSSYRFELDCLDEKLKSIIHKKKIRAGLLMDVFESHVDVGIEKLAEHIRLNDGFITEEFSITVVSALEAEDGAKSKIEIIGNIGATEGDCKIIQIQAGQPFIKIIQGRYGKHGRDGFGKIILANVVEDISMPIINVPVEVLKESTTEGETFIAKFDGFAEVSGNAIRVGNAFERAEVSFKTTGNISMGDVKVVVQQNDSSIDAISNAHIECGQIDIEGAFGADSNITAGHVNLGGQSNATSKITCATADLKFHKGHVVAKEKVSVASLEPGGKIETKLAYVEIASGGHINAEEVHIGILKSGNHITATKKISIEKVEGSDNYLTMLIEKDDEKAKLLQEYSSARKELGRISNAINDIEKHFKVYRNEIQKTESAIELCKRKGINPEPAVKNAYEKIIALKNDLLKLQTDKHIAKQLLTKTHKDIEENELKACRPEIYCPIGINTADNFIFFVDQKVSKKTRAHSKDPVYHFSVDSASNIICETTIKM